MKRRAASKARGPSSAEPVLKRTIRVVGTMLLALSSVAWLAAVAGWFRGARRVPVLREAAEAEKPRGCLRSLHAASFASLLTISLIIAR